MCVIERGTSEKICQTLQNKNIYRFCSEKILCHVVHYHQRAGLLE